MSFKISVGPLMEDIVLIKMKRGAVFQIGENKQTVLLGNLALKQIALEQNFQISRHSDQIVVYKAWHENGFVQYYVNKSNNLLLTEMVIFELENL
jgi:hypothetical protein